MKLLELLLTLYFANLDCIYGSKVEKQLIRHLLKLNDLEPQERPAENHSDNVTVSIGLSIKRIDAVVEDKHHVEFTVWLNLEWQAYNLKWEPSKFGNIDSLRLHPSKIWMPDDIYSYTEMGQDKDPFHQTMVVVKSTGEIRYMPSGKMTNHCRLNGSSYPFENLLCPITFGSWVHAGDKIDLELDPNMTAVDKGFIESPEWKVLGCPSEKTQRYYECCSEPYLDVQFLLKLQRRGEGILAEAKSFSFFALGLLFMSCVLGPSNTFKMLFALVSMSFSIFSTIRFDPRLGTSEPTELAKYFVKLSYLGFLILFTNLLTYYLYFKIGSVPDKAKQLLDKLPKFGSRALWTRAPLDDTSRPTTQDNYNDLQELSLSENQPKHKQLLRKNEEWKQLSLLLDKAFFIIWTLVLLIFDFAAFPSYEI